MEGVFLKDYPPEAFTIKCLEVAILENLPTTFYSKDSLALLATEGGLQRFEKHLKSWMKKIQAGLANQIETRHIVFRNYSLKASN